ncbi:MAG: hypothetical protein HY278_06380 [candidate division NC10 bacterium]|nr:hypothetical protein [candidate division NC10 bacterium]
MESLEAWEIFATWVGKLLTPVLRELLERKGNTQPTEADLQRAFVAPWPECSTKLMVQEPWMGTVRFKWLARYQPEEFEAMVLDPMGYLSERFGGGKFKVNFYQGMNFLATRNFKPEGEPKWKEMPELQED